MQLDNYGSSIVLKVQPLFFASAKISTQGRQMVMFNISFLYRNRVESHFSSVVEIFDMFQK